MKIAVGSDQNAFELKKAVCEFLEEKGVQYHDFGVYTPDPVGYPDQARVVAEAVARGEFDRGR